MYCKVAELYGKEKSSKALGQLHNNFMVFSSTIFLFVFLPILLFLYYCPVFKGRKSKNIILLAASLGFYAWGEPVFVFLMLLSILVTWGIGLKLTRTKLILGITYNIGILFVFKYLTYVCHCIGQMRGLEIDLIQIRLPIGISFFTFQLISYLVDIYRGRLSENQA